MTNFSPHDLSYVDDSCLNHFQVAVMENLNGCLKYLFLKDLFLGMRRKCEFSSQLAYVCFFLRNTITCSEDLYFFMALVTLLFLCVCVCVFNLCFLIFGCARFLLLCQLFSSCGERGLHSNCGAWASSCGDFFCCRAQILGRTGFSSRGPHDEGTGSVVVTHRLSSLRRV